MSASIWRLFPRTIVWTALIFAGWSGDGARASERDCDYCPETELMQVGDSAAQLAVGIHEVTQGEFNRFVEDTDHSLGDSCGVWDDEARLVRWLDPRDLVGPADHPVICVSWEDAQAYVRWLSKSTRKHWRLLTEAEWEYVARADTNAGDTISTSQAVYGREYRADRSAPTEPVGSFEPNGFGLHDVRGNVWEWTADCREDGAAAKSGDRSGGGYRRDASVGASANEDCRDAVLRGGSWRDDASAIGSEARSAASAGDRTAYYGFRVARSELDGLPFRDCPHCPEMVVVPSGDFMMGSPRSDGDWQDDEEPQHRVTIGSTFAVGVYEVTFAEWDACVSRGGCGGYRPYDEGWGRSRRPVVNVSWNDAQSYVAWLSRETGESYRLLSESEWEYVARAGTKTRYWWGDDIGRNRASCESCGSGWDEESTAPKGSFAANGFGLHDVHGNVWEWVQDCRNESYDGAPDDGSSWDNGDCSERVLRGGSWDDHPVDLRAAARYADVTGNRDDYAGFRVARTLTR